jgi:hypothetical protein
MSVMKAAEDHSFEISENVSAIEGQQVHRDALLQNRFEGAD